MNMHRRSLLSAVPMAFGLCIAPFHVHAQQATRAMVVSSGEKAGTYYRLMENLGQFCPAQFENTESDGSLTNIDLVMNNQAEMGLTQFDALYLRGQKEPNLKDRIRILATLHPEEIHFIAKSAPHWDWSATIPKRVTFDTITELKGRNVGFWGGTIVTEQIITALALIGWNPIELTDQASALAALNRDDVDVIMAVGGQPLKWVSQLSRDYKLLEVTEPVASRLSTVYDKAVLTYRNLGQDGVPSLSIRAMLVTRNYDSNGMRDRLQALRDCLWKKIPEIRETRGTHPKWQKIEPMDLTEKWPMYFPPTK